MRQSDRPPFDTADLFGLNFLSPKSVPTRVTIVDKINPAKLTLSTGRKLYYVVLMAVAMGVCTGCDTRHRIYAVYDAPGTGVQVRIWTTGILRFGEEQLTKTQTSVLVCPAVKTGPWIHMVEVPGIPLHYSTGNGYRGTLQWDWKNAEREFSWLIGLTGQPTNHAAEVAEMVRAIKRTAYGPNGTLLPGQTKSLLAAQVIQHAKTIPKEITSCAEPSNHSTDSKK